MDLRPVKTASRAELASFAIAAAKNAQGLLDEAELLASSACNGRAYALAVLAVEEIGKSVDLAALAGLPESFRARAPLRRLLECHSMKLVGGLLLSVLPHGHAAARLAAMTPGELNRTLAVLAPAIEADRLKRRGLYVDMEQAGIREPSEITGADVAGQLDRSRQAAGELGSAFLGPEFRTWLEDPPAEGLALAEDLVTALINADHVRTPQAAIDVMLQAVAEYRAADPAARNSGRAVEF